MLLNTLLLLVTGAAAWTVPADQPDGVYSVQADEFGGFKHTLIRHTATATATNATPNLTTRSAKFHPKRDNTGSNNIDCGGYALSPSDLANAQRELENQCGNGAFVQGGLDFYSITGDSVVYYCNFSDDINNCFASEASDAFARIVSDCGPNNAGWDTIPARSDSYGYESVGANFCGRGV